MLLVEQSSVCEVQVPCFLPNEEGSKRDMSTREDHLTSNQKVTVAPPSFDSKSHLLRLPPIILINEPLLFLRIV